LGENGGAIMTRRQEEIEAARHQAMMHGGEAEDYLDQKYKNGPGGNGKWKYGSMGKIIFALIG
jgi:hypothetical protein